MKRLLFVLLGILLVPFAETYAQDITPGMEEETEWYDYEFDSHMDVSMPGDEVYEQDTMVEGKKIFQLNGYYDFANFAVQRLHGLDWRQGRRRGELPYDKESLLEYYSKVTKGIGKAAGDDDLSGSEVLMDGLVGYEYDMFGLGGDHYISTRLLLLEDSLYFFSYANPVDWDDSEKSFFFNNANIHNPSGINQYKGPKPSSAEEMGEFFGQLIFYVGMAVALFFVVRNQRRNRRHRRKMENTPWRPSPEFFNPPPPPPTTPEAASANQPSPPNSDPSSPTEPHSPESPSDPPRSPDEPPPLPPR